MSHGVSPENGSLFGIIPLGASIGDSLVLFFGKMNSFNFRLREHY